MTLPILITKLSVPPLRSEWVSRPRLLERLDGGLARKLTIISAPAGFGKTTLLSEWVTKIGIDHVPARLVAWLSLGKEDNDPVLFWTCFITALQQVWPELGKIALEMLQSSPVPAIESVLSDLLNEITLLESQQMLCSIIVLDDYHWIETVAIHDGVSFLLDHLPEGIHLVIASRVDPPFSLSRFRGRHQLTELRTADLCFTADEAALFLNQIMGLDLSGDEIAVLEQRTEGWIVGLQMAALSLQGKGRETVQDAVASFSGSHHFVLDYLLEEVLKQQPESLRTFMLQTAVLDRLGGPVCDAVVDWGAEDGEWRLGDGRWNMAPRPLSSFLSPVSFSQQILEYLDHANLFLIPLDGERRWYRYHHLFADLLRNRLERTQPDLVPTLHLRASVWYEESGFAAEAVRHALAAGEIERVAQLVEGNALAMVDHGQLALLGDWLDAIPEPVVRSRPWLCIARAWLLSYAGQLEAVESLLQAAEGSLSELDRIEAADRQRITGHIAAIRVNNVYLAGDDAAVIAFARQALQLLPDQDSLTRSLVATRLPFALRATGDFEASVKASVDAVAAAKAAGDSHVTVLALCEMAGLLSAQGHLHQAAATYEDALRLASDHARRSGRPLGITGYVYGRLSTVLREWNDLEGAVRMAQQGLALCQQWGGAEELIECYLYLALALQSAGDETGALEAIRHSRNLAEGLSEWYGSQLIAYEARLRLAQGDLAAAVSLMQKIELAPEIENSIDTFGYSVHIIILIAQGKSSEALELSARLLDIAERENLVGPVIKTLVLQAIALYEMSKEDQALSKLERALVLAEPEGWTRSFLVEGFEVETLLQQAAARDIAPGYAAKLLVALEAQGTKHIPSQPSSPLSHRGAFYERLSKRELEVLQLLEAGLSNKEMAQELIIAMGTVKNHLQNIYEKLGVHSRIQAVTRARELGLL